MNDVGSRSRVLIVGAGPVGLVLACELLARNVDVCVIDKSEKLDNPHSRATVLWPRVLELLNRLDVTRNVIETGHYFDRLGYYSKKKRVGEVRLDRLRGTQYPYAIAIPQSRTEQILAARLAELGGSVRLGCELVAGSQTEHGVECVLSDDTSEPQSEVFDWVIGADGASSTVRRLFDFTFDGQTLPTRLAITDAELVGEVTKNEAAYFLTKRGNMALGPLGGDVFRVAASVPAWYTGGDRPDRSFFERLLAERVPGVKEVGSMSFSAIFVAHVRTAERFRKGRVLLAGDAAHVMSPAGAQGMNTGIQDAMNLGWKLAGVVNGLHDARILDTYDTERRSAAHRVAKSTTQLARVGLYTENWKMAARDYVMRAGSATRLFDRVVAPQLAQLDTAYGKTPQTKGLHVGQRLPLGWTDTDASPVLARDSFTVLLWPGAEFRQSDWNPRVEAMTKALAGAEVRVIDLAGRPVGTLYGQLGSHPRAFVVRPDGHLAATADLAGREVGDCAAKLAETFGIATFRTHPHGVKAIGAR
ncbi:FAD-dependent monooxygenase [Streptomyces sp. NPDC001793]|uniref:FAD-dependent monooxygenase n=1 Tax=Streptomyces sp. NPDC001793 TaxID=3154657 RepID=UPI0033213DD6